MASLKDAQKLTQNVKQQAIELHRALTDDELDFRRVVDLADELGESVDRIAGTFQTIDDAFAGVLEGEGPGDGGGESSEASQQQSGESEGSSGDGGANGDTPELEGDGSITRQELLEMAKEAGIRRRTTMSKEELASALERVAASAGE